MTFQGRFAKNSYRLEIKLLFTFQVLLLFAATGYGKVTPRGINVPVEKVDQEVERFHAPRLSENDFRSENRSQLEHLRCSKDNCEFYSLKPETSYCYGYECSSMKCVKCSAVDKPCDVKKDVCCPTMVFKSYCMPNPKNPDETTCQLCKGLGATCSTNPEFTECCQYPTLFIIFVVPNRVNVSVLMNSKEG